MTKSRTKSEAEHLRGVVRDLKSQNRNLKKQLARKEKRAFIETEEEAEPFIQEEKELPTYKENCPDCNGNLETVDLGIKKLLMCENCNYRVVKK